MTDENVACFPQRRAAKRKPTAHPGGVAMLMAGRPTKLSDLVREPAALEEARRRARTIRAKAIVAYCQERGIPYI